MTRADATVPRKVILRASVNSSGTDRLRFLGMALQLITAHGQNILRSKWRYAPEPRRRGLEIISILSCTACTVVIVRAKCGHVGAGVCFTHSSLWPSSSSAAKSRPFRDTRDSRIVLSRSSHTRSVPRCSRRHILRTPKKIVPCPKGA